MLRIALFVAILCGTLITPAAARAAGPLAYGMQVHAFGQNQERILDAVKGAGFGWVKQQVRWADLEQTKGTIDFNRTDPFVRRANAAGVKLLYSVVAVPAWARQDGSSSGPPNNVEDFARFMAAMAARYKGQVQAWEIWNEQNMSGEWSLPIDACSYVKLLKAVAPRVKAADPATIVITGALTPTGVMDPNGAIDDAVYLDQMYKCDGGAFKTLGNAVGAHATGYNNAPEDWIDSHSVDTPGFKDHESFYFKRVWQLHDVMLKNGDARQMWLTEYHWGAADPLVPAGYEWTTHLDEATVAGFFVRSIGMMKAEPWIAGFFIWNLNFRTIEDYHTRETAIFGILNEDWSPRLIYQALSDMPK
jgi:polysaccharide biosynthesis protein PslG